MKARDLSHLLLSNWYLSWSEKCSQESGCKLQYKLFWKPALRGCGGKEASRGALGTSADHTSIQEPVQSSETTAKPVAVGVIGIPVLQRWGQAGPWTLLASLHYMVSAWGRILEVDLCPPHVSTHTYARALTHTEIRWQDQRDLSLHRPHVVLVPELTQGHREAFLLCHSI